MCLSKRYIEIFCFWGSELKLKQWYKTITFLLSLIIIINARFIIIPVNALNEDEITAPSAVLIEAETGQVLYEKNSHEIRACASITKVMTLLLVFEAIDNGKISFDDKVTASEHASSMGGSDIWLEVGETMTVDEMIKATVVASANDAAVALAEFVAGSEDEFVYQMNERAKELGMKDTVFKNCNGLDEEGHLTSAYDVALMSMELIKHKKIYDYTSIWMDYLRDGKTQLVNTNKLLKSYNGITGLKTGTTGQAGSCISATAQRNGLSLIAVVLGSATGNDRFKDASKILDYGFANYAMYKPEVPDNIPDNIDVLSGMEKTVGTKVDSDISILVKKGEEKNIKSNVSLVENVEAPVKEGQKIGEVIYKLNDEVICKYPIKTANNVNEITFKDIFSIIFNQLVQF